jgi:hypothetical protein
MQPQALVPTPAVGIQRERTELSFIAIGQSDIGTDVHALWLADAAETLRAG